MASRTDTFLDNLKQMQSTYPEYKGILQFLIEQIQQGKLANIQLKLQQLKDTDWQ
jgi:hypothetical protein